MAPSNHDPDDESRASNSDAETGLLGENKEVSSHSGGSSSETTSGIGLVEAQERSREVAEELLERPLESVIKIEANDDGWRTVVEVLERSAVPDTQDIIGRYEITLDATGNVSGYEMLERYRRGELKTEL